ncbi:MAG: DUF1998 domain-containing protein [Ruminiclostridium sp.]|nr:DUF1998 domain-containing protein [Ruminiclostridium sp.]
MSGIFRNKRNGDQKIHIGEIRKSQLLTTFGVGNIVDFVRDTAIIGGVDDWDKDSNSEDRKITNENLQAFTGAKYFLQPKSSGSPTYMPNNQDISSFIFPEKLYCPKCKSIIDYRELQVSKNRQTCNQIDANGKPCRGHLVASRFVVICEKGHLEDFPYSWWVHKGKECPSRKLAPRIKMYNIGGRSDAESLMIECSECKAKRGMVGIFNKNAFSGECSRCCSGKHPYLGSNYKQECDSLPTVRLRSSSSVYFPINPSALLIPPWSQKAMAYIEKDFDQLSYMSDEKRKEYIKKYIFPKCAKLTLEDLFEAFKTLETRRLTGHKKTEADIYEEEYRILCRSEVMDDRFSSHNVTIPVDFCGIFDQIAVIDRLVVTMALSGFTRLYPYNGETAKDKIAPLSIERKEWLPAIELIGEGIFIRFNKARIVEWAEKVYPRYNEMKKAHEQSFIKSEKYSPQYVMLHTFAHLFIRQLANECGYSAASMKEKIYSTFSNNDESYEMNGVLIYLSSSDSDGSLGGLISAAEETELLDRILKNMLREAKWCSGDPLCGSNMHQGFASLNYSACHACTLLPETACEFSNLLLDRISVVGAIDNSELGIMGNLAESL